MPMPEVKNQKGFPLPAVDKSNLQYQHVVKDLNNRAIADFRKALKIDPEFTRAYRTLSRLLKSKSQQPAGRNAKTLEYKKERPKNPQVD